MLPGKRCYKIDSNFQDLLSRASFLYACALGMSVHSLTSCAYAQVLDETAFTLCKDNRIPVLVFDLHAPGNILRAVQGRPSLGTVVDSEPDHPDDIAPQAQLSNDSQFSVESATGQSLSREHHLAQLSSHALSLEQSDAEREHALL